MANSDDKSLPDQALEALLYAPIGIAYEVLDRLPTWVARGKSQATITKVLGKMAVQKGQSEFEGVVSDIFGVKLGEEPAAPANGAPANAKAPAGKTAATSKTATVAKTKTAAKSSKGESSTSKATATSATSKKNSSSKSAASKKKATSKKTASTKAPAKKAPSKKTVSAKKSDSAKKSATKSAPDKKAPKAAKKKKPAKQVTVPVEADLALASYGSMPASQIVKRLDSLSETQLDDIRRFEEANRHRVTVLSRIRQIQRSA